MSTDTAHALHEDILNYIDQASALLQTGEMAQLNGLDARIEELCQRVIAMHESERAPFVDKLEVLQQRLEDLTNHMQSARNSLKTEMGALAKRDRARKAYKPKGGAQ